MSETAILGQETLPVPTNKYLYPNTYSYSNFGNSGRYNQPPAFANLKKGMLFTLSKQSSFIPMPFANMHSAKAFQFNPPEIDLAFQAISTAPSGVEENSGNTPPVLGAGSTNIQLLFIREQEVYKAMQGAIGSGQSGVPIADAYGRLGAQQDVYEVMQLLMSATDTADAALPQDGTMRNITARMINLITASTMITASQIGIAFSNDFVVYGNLTGLSLNYPKWSANLVPTWAYVNISVDILNIANVRSVLQTGGAAPNSMTTTDANGMNFNPFDPIGNAQGAITPAQTPTPTGPSLPGWIPNGDVHGDMGPALVRGNPIGYVPPGTVAY